MLSRPQLGVKLRTRTKSLNDVVQACKDKAALRRRSCSIYNELLYCAGTNLLYSISSRAQTRQGSIQIEEDKLYLYCCSFARSVSQSFRSLKKHQGHMQVVGVAHLQAAPP